MMLDFRRYPIVHDLLRESTVFLGVKSGGLLIEFFGRTGENIEQVRSHWPRAWSCCTWVGSVVSTLCNFSSKSLSKSKFFIKALHGRKNIEQVKSTDFQWQSTFPASRTLLATFALLPTFIQDSSVIWIAKLKMHIFFHGAYISIWQSIYEMSWESQNSQCTYFHIAIKSENIGKCWCITHHKIYTIFEPNRVFVGYDI